MSERLLGATAARQHGVITRAQARTAGLSDDQIDRRQRSGALVRLQPDVYRFPTAAETWRTYVMAAVLAAGPGAVASHRSAGRLQGLRDVPRWKPEITVPGSRLPILTEVVVHRSTLLEEADAAEIDGIPTTCLPRTLLDLGAVLPIRSVASAAEEAAVRRLVTTADLVCVLDRVGGPGRRGTATLRRVVRAMMPADGLESLLEVKLLRLVRAAVGEEPHPQHDLVCHDGRRARLDLAWPRHRIAVEADGRRWHATSAAFERDLARGNAITGSGWQLYRFGWTDVVDRPEVVHATLRRAFHQVA